MRGCPRRCHDSGVSAALSYERVVNDVTWSASLGVDHATSIKGGLPPGNNLPTTVQAGVAAEWATWRVGAAGQVDIASGAISAIFGLYAVFFGRPKQVTSNMRLNRSIHVAWLLVTWVALQWMAGMLAGGEGVMLATPAHIGGFIAGLLMQRPLLLWRYRKA